MAPTITAAMINSQDHLTLTHKLRKPLVEKLRRERINSSIEQLKSLLGPEFLKQQPESKLEKADILEMTVCFLRQLQHQHPAVSVNQGYSRCVEEVDHFLSRKEVKRSHTMLIKNFHKLQSSSDKNQRDDGFSPVSSTIQTSITKEKTSANSAPWRPW